METTPVTIHLGTCNDLPFVVALDQDTPHMRVFGPGYTYLFSHIMEDLMDIYTPQEISILTIGEKPSNAFFTTPSYMDFVQTADWSGDATAYATEVIESRLGLFEHDTVANNRAFADRVSELPQVVIFTDTWDESLQSVLTLGGLVGIHIITGWEADYSDEFVDASFAVDAESYRDGVVTIDGSSSFVRWQ